MSNYEKILLDIDFLDKKNKKRYEELRKDHSIADSHDILIKEIESKIISKRLEKIFNDAFNNPPEVIVAKKLMDMGYTSETVANFKICVNDGYILKVRNEIRDREKGFKK